MNAIEHRPILLVEDNPDDEMLTKRAFRKNNIDNPVVVARDGVEALDYMFQRGAFALDHDWTMPSLILLDLNLPRVNGLDVLKHLRSEENTRNVAVVVLTTSTEDVDLLKSYNLGANSYVREPVEFEMFIDTVKQLSAYWLGINCPSPDGVLN